VIRYSLRCGRGHEFEGWFRSSAAFAEEAAALACPLCDDRRIEKAIMAPAVLHQTAPPAATAAEPAAAGDAAPQPGTAKPAAAALPVVAAAAAPAPPAPRPEQLQLARMVTALRRLRAHVETHFEPVGDRFAEEARKIHAEESEPRGIYGRATADEVRELEEEGIDVAPLPNLPKLDG